MLETLELRNVGVIKSANLTFRSGLTAITGETGAGKSMLLSSLSLISGEQPERIKTLKESANEDIEVTATFSEIPKQVEQIVADSGAYLDNGELIIARNISAETKRSKAFLGGKTMPQSVLQEIAPELVVIHGQQEQLQLKNPQKVRELLDTYAGLIFANSLAKFPINSPTKDDVVVDDFHDYKQAFAEYKSLEKSLNEHSEKQADLKKNYDYYRFIIEQIEKVNPKVDEDVELEGRLETLRNIGEIGTHFSQALTALQGGDTTDDTGYFRGALELIAAAQNDLQYLEKFSYTFESEIDKLAQTQDLLNEVASVIQGRVADLEYNPGELEFLEARKSELKQLTNSWGDTIEEVLATYEKAKASVEEFENQASLEELEIAHAKAREKVTVLAQKLLQTRQGAAKEFSGNIAIELAKLGFNDAQVLFEVTASESYTAKGADTIALLFSPHPSLAPKPLEKVASGGELSRIMLAIEVVLMRKAGSARGALGDGEQKEEGSRSQVRAGSTARNKELANMDGASNKDLSGGTTANLPLMVFDEIDAGIGGEAANQVANLLFEMSQYAQIIIVTHLANLAAKADHHFSITKLEDTDTSVASVKELDKLEREAEIARMLSGSATDAAIEHARELLG